MPRYATADGKGTNVEAGAEGQRPAGRQPGRQRVVFGVVVGIALLLSGFGFAILAIGGALRNPDSALNPVKKSAWGRTSPAPAA